MHNSNLKMKELEASTGVGREAIRFYIKEGLLPKPVKPKRNVALYSQEHVVRLKMIKRLQQERSMQLAQIKSAMIDADFSNLTSDSDLAAFEFTFLSLVNGNVAQKAISLTEASKKTGFSKSELEAMHTLEIISIIKSTKGRFLNFHDVGVLDKWAKIKSLGFEDDKGYDLTFLKRYVEVTRLLAKTEVELFLNAYARQSPEEGAEMGLKGVETVNELLGILHTRAVAEEVSRQVD